MEGLVVSARRRFSDSSSKKRIAFQCNILQSGVQVDSPSFLGEGNWKRHTILSFSPHFPSFVAISLPVETPPFSLAGNIFRCRVLFCHLFASLPFRLRIFSFQSKSAARFLPRQHRKAFVASLISTLKWICSSLSFLPTSPSSFSRNPRVI